MKKLFTLLLTLVFVFALSACDNTRSGAKQNNNANTPTQSETDLITRDRALDLALNHAGLTLDDVYDLEAELDYERGVTYWEVDFESKNLEYSYDINAQTEEITRLEKERD